MLVAFAALNNLNKELSAGEVLQSVVESVGGKDNFRFHTDTHAEKDQKGSGMGCGHLKFARQNLENYGLKSEQVEFLMHKLSEMSQESAVCQVILEGDHEEQAVVVVESDHYSLRPLVRRDSGLQEAFIYQKTLHGKQLRKLAEVLAGKVGVEVDDIEQALHSAFDKQLSETLSRLAQGKPVYTVKFNHGGTPIVE